MRLATTSSRRGHPGRRAQPHGGRGLGGVGESTILRGSGRWCWPDSNQRGRRSDSRCRRSRLDGSCIPADWRSRPTVAPASGCKFVGPKAGVHHRTGSSRSAAARAAGASAPGSPPAPPIPVPPDPAPPSGPPGKRRAAAAAARRRGEQRRQREREGNPPWGPASLDHQTRPRHHPGSSREQMVSARGAAGERAPGLTPRRRRRRDARPRHRRLDRAEVIGRVGCRIRRGTGYEAEWKDGRSREVARRRATSRRSPADKKNKRAFADKSPSVNRAGPSISGGLRPPAGGADRCATLAGLCTCGGG